MYQVQTAATCLSLFSQCSLDLGDDAMVTTFATGAEFNATFHLAYPHRVNTIIKSMYA